MDNLKEYWNRGKKEKFIVSAGIAIVLFLFFLIFRRIRRGSGSVSTGAETGTGAPVQSSGLVYGTVGTNTDVGYLNDEKFEGINTNFDVFRSNIDQLFAAQEVTNENLDNIKSETQSIIENQTKSEDPLDRLFFFADEITKAKNDYVNATTNEEKILASTRANRIRQNAYAYAIKNNLTINEKYYVNPLLKEGGYTEYIIEGVSI